MTICDADEVSFIALISAECLLFLIALAGQPMISKTCMSHVLDDPFCEVSNRSCPCNRNLAGHHMLYGELPRAWYNQTLFERLFYLKLKGTKIRADMTRLQWKGELPT